ncbi:MAG: hypothetical protein RL398_1051 [Planctomycetota bacterium]|jgi:prepilin-type N-terminal cleavage/methylation domain-containing protein
MNASQSGFSLLEMIIVTAVISTVAGVTAPNLFSSRTMANERAVISTLRNLGTAQTQCIARAAVDADNDGVGEALSLPELAGRVELRTGAPALSPNSIATSLGITQASGYVSTKGYLMALYLPDANGDGVLGTAANYGSIDPDNAEVAWSCLAWPMSRGRSGTSTYFTNQSGEVLVAREANYDGLTSVPPAGAAMAGTPAQYLMGTELAVDRAGADGNVWRVPQ